MVISGRSRGGDAHTHNLPLMPGIHCAISVRFPCDFSKVSTHTVREDRMRCKAKVHDLCALTIRSDCRARFMCSHYTCEILGFTVANSRETNKQPQLQKQAQYFFYDLLSSILFIISYLLPINEPHIYSLKYIGGHSMEISIFLSLAFTEILHLKNTWLQFLYIYFK